MPTVQFTCSDCTQTIEVNDEMRETILETGCPVCTTAASEDDFDDDRAVYAESTGVGQYSPDAKGILAKIPPEWNEDHYMIRTEDAMFVSDAFGDRALDLDTGEKLPEREAELRERAEEIRGERRLYDGDESRDVGDAPEDVQDRLEHLGYR